MSRPERWLGTRGSVVVQQWADAPLQLRGLRQLLQGAPRRGPARPAARARGAERRRPLEPRRGARRPQPGAARADARARRRPPARASRTRSSGTSPTARDSCPTDRYERAQVLQWQFFEQYQHEPSIAVVRFLIAFSGQAEKHADRIREQTANGYIALDAMERHLDRPRLPRRRALHDRRHLALRLHARGARGRLRPRAVPRDPGVARAGRRARPVTSRSTT